jgi:hypothetical protein
MKSILIAFVTVSSIVCIGCSQDRSYLATPDKAWNPYKAGSILIFTSSQGRTDTITITKIEDNRFPDGLGAEMNERLRVLAKLYNRSISKGVVEVRLLYMYAKTKTNTSKLDFELSLGDGFFAGKAFPIEALEEYKEEYLELSNRTFNDVIRLDDNSNQVLGPNDIVRIYWSKSVGYVKCETKDGTVWELVNIIDNP